MPSPLAASGVSAVLLTVNVRLPVVAIFTALVDCEAGWTPAAPLGAAVGPHESVALPP